MSSEKTSKKYSNYIKNYEKWCKAKGFDHCRQRSLDEYREYLINDKCCGTSYVRQVVNRIVDAHHLQVPSSNVEKERERFTELEISQLVKFSEAYYMQDEIFLILQLMFAYPQELRNLARVKKLTRFQTNRLSKTKETNVALYLLATTFDKHDEEILFPKSFGTYAGKFKRRQKILFPDSKRYKNFYELSKHLREFRS